MTRRIISHLGVFCATAGGAGLAIAIFLGIDLRNHPDPVFSRKELLACYAYMDALSLTFHTFAQDHGGKFPFSVSTNLGGTREFCATGSDGVDRNALRHFQVLSNDFGSPKFLVCPNDKLTKAAANFAHLRSSNITYVLFSGTNLDYKSHEILMLCPVDGNVAYANGEIRCASVEGPPLPADLLSYIRHEKGPFRKAIVEIIVSVMAAVLLLAAGLGLIFKSRNTAT